MAIRLRRLLFGAPQIARVAHANSLARLSYLIGRVGLDRWSTAESVETGWDPTRQSFSPNAPATGTVLVVIPGPDHDPIPQLHLARTLGADIRAVYVDGDTDRTQRLLGAWPRCGDGIPLLVLQGDGLPMAASLRAYVDLLARERPIGEISILLPVCESGTCRAKIRCALMSVAARLAFGGRPGVRVVGGQAGMRSGRKLAGCPAEA